MVRYSDKPSVESSIEIAAPVSAVWDLVTDINLPARFSPEFLGAEFLGAEFLGAEWLDEDGPFLGARFVGRNGHRATGEWQTTCTVTWFEPPHSFG